jgi:hypothetical protein
METVTADTFEDVIEDTSIGPVELKLLSIYPLGSGVELL